MPGTTCDGLEFAADAIARGAVAIASERDPRQSIRGLGVPWLRVPSARVAAGRLADLVYRDPSALIVLIAVTGSSALNVWSAAEEIVGDEDPLMAMYLSS